MNVANTIEKKIKSSLSLIHFELKNESSMHSGPATESHFKLTMVSKDFCGLSPVKRHQRVYKCLSDELEGPVHALALHLYTDTEWASIERISPESPLCASKVKQ